MAIFRIRDLSPAEAKKVDASALPVADRPSYYNATTGTLEKISAEFEVFLILTPLGTRTSLANFFSVVTGNKGLEDTSDRKALLEDWMKEEIADIKKEIEIYGELADEYSKIKAELINFTSGFESVDEVNKLTVDLNNAVGDYAYTRDNLVFMKAVDTVLKNRSASGELSEEIEQEIKSWVKVLLTY